MTMAEQQATTKQQGRQRIAMKKLVIALCRAQQRVEKRDTARYQYRQQLQRCRQVSTSQYSSRGLILRELDNLNRRMEEVIRHEAELLRLGKEDAGKVTSLMQQIAELKSGISRLESSHDSREQQKIESMLQALERLDARLQDAKEETIEKVTVAVRKAVPGRRKLPVSKPLAKSERGLQAMEHQELRAKLYALEKKHDELKAKGHPEDILAPIGERIISLKTLLDYPA